jgi:hypothetical protein
MGEITTINEQLVEIRYKPNPTILDYRGSWVEAISNHMQLTEWKIDINRIDSFDKQNTQHVFVSFKNAGSTFQDTKTKNYLSDKTNKFLKFLFEQPAFGKELHIFRIGVRGRFASTFDGKYDDLLQLFQSNYFTLSGPALEAFNAEVKDIGLPINYTTDHGNINSVIGPMPKAQLEKNFSQNNREPFPESSLYVDLDYWIRPDEILQESVIRQKIKIFSEEIWEIHDRIQAIFFDS